jgi:hypothetical protein
MVITGDIHQCDNTENGLNDLLIRVSKRYGQERNDEHMDHEHMDHEHIRNDLISIVEFDTGDIQRSAIITTILDLYES